MTARHSHTLAVLSVVALAGGVAFLALGYWLIAGLYVGIGLVGAWNALEALP